MENWTLAEWTWAAVAAITGMYRFAAGHHAFLAGMIAVGLLTAWVASRKNRSPIAWGAAAMLFGIIPLIILAFKRKLVGEELAV